MPWVVCHICSLVMIISPEDGPPGEAKRPNSGTPWDGKSLQFGGFCTLPVHLQHILKEREVCAGRELVSRERRPLAPMKEEKKEREVCAGRELVSRERRPLAPVRGSGAALCSDKMSSLEQDSNYAGFGRILRVRALRCSASGSRCNGGGSCGFDWARGATGGRNMQHRHATPEGSSSGQNKCTQT